MKACLIVILSIASHALLAQGVNLNFGIGIGGILEEEHSAGRGQLFLGAQMAVKERTSLGIELSTGGNLLPVDGTSGFDGNTKILSPYSSRSLMALAKGKYEVEKSFGFPFIAFGAGIGTNKFYVHSVDTKEVSKHNFVGLIEAGVAFENGLTTSLKYTAKSRSPNFSGVDMNGGNILLEEAAFSTIHLTLGYRLQLFQK